jgi:ABC-type nitrate/sulfonate/bicarbonate transport system substrate-binding protein
MRSVVAAAAALALLAAGCGGSGPSDSRREATLVLDFTPNAVHAGIYTMLSRDYDGAESTDLTVREPSSSTDSVKLLLARRADFAILDIHDLAIAREKGRDVVGVMALVQTPLAAILVRPGPRRPTELEGRRVGISGLPSDTAVLRSVVSGDGGNPDRVRRVTIGFNAVPALLSKRVDGVVAFWNAEGVALRARRPDIREFRVDRYGAPPYPELVLCVARETLQDEPGLVRRVVAAIRRGYEEALADPESAVSALVDAVPGLKRELVARELEAVQPSFTSGVRRFGQLDRARLRAWAAWEQRFGIVKTRPAVDQAFATAVSSPGD